MNEAATQCFARLYELAALANEGPDFSLNTDPSNHKGIPEKRLFSKYFFFKSKTK